jgi:predicted RNA binding protein YcfA (HicA-like mRNA interferase family)
MGQWDKLQKKILKLDKNLRFEELAKVLRKIGYKQEQPRGGSSHYTFRKQGKPPITMPKATPMKEAYIEIVKNAILQYEAEKEERK